MAWYPKAIRKELSQNRTQPIIKPVGVVLHTAVSDGGSLFDFFNGRSSGVESHFYVRKTGVVEQYMDTARRADCQRDGNYFDGKGFLSIETWDGGHPEATPWNARQVTALVDLVTWMCKTHGFAAVKATGAQGTGIGYHAQFTGTNFPRWNLNHSCPAAKRIPQVPGITAAVKAKLATPIEEDPLAGITLDQIRAVVQQEVWKKELTPGATTRAIGGYPEGFHAPAAAFQYASDAKLNEVRRTLKALGIAIAKLTESVATDDEVKAAVREALADVLSANLEVHVEVDGDPTT